jgi:hypothetical protein
VHFDDVPRDTLLSEEGGYFDPLITLQLDNLTHLLVVNEGAVTGEFLRRNVSHPYKQERTGIAK